MLKPITYVYLETTNYCNLACSFCNRDEVIGTLQHMPISKFRKLLESIKDHPIKEGKLMGMGEPMLHPKFDQICKIFKDYFPSAKLIVATNCQYKIKESFTNSLKYIDLLYFSIDGYKESYERDRAPAKWDKLITFLDKFKEVNRYKCDVVINYVVNPDNIYDIQKIDRLRKDNKLGELRLNIAQDWSEDKSLPGGYNKEQILYLKTNWSNNIKGKSKWDYEDCFWVEEALYTTVEGNVKMCCMNTGAKPCKTNNPTSHCKNCSYKELVPILSEVKN